MCGSMDMGRAVPAVLAVIVLSVLFAPLLTSFDPEGIDLDELRRPPDLRHPFGTDNKGRDIFARVLYGGRVSLAVAMTAAVFSTVTGLLVGLVAGYAGGRTETALVALMDFVLAFPSLLLAIGISVVLPQGILTVMIAISAVGWASFARLVRGSVVALRSAPYIEAAQAIGCGSGRIVFVHLLPQCLPLVIVMAGMKLGGYILTEASLGFLGLGAQPPTPTWGGMVSANRVLILSAPWTVLFPGLAITLTALAFNLLGDTLRDSYGVKLRG